MSDFDKEAEREKLREKYERDKAEREATQRMSDLLLKGATMTNMHCGTCGDPLFKQDGTTFCPSCHGNPDAVEGTDLEAQPAEEAPDAAGTDESAATDASAQSIDVASPSDADAAPDAGAAETASTTDTSAEPDRTDSSGADERDRRASASGERSRESGPSRRVRQADDAETPSRAADRDSQSAAEESRAGGRRDRATRRAAASPPVDGDLERARESLVQALEKFAGEAAATDDPRYATECLEAAREAGETLSTLR
ncbi:Sjogren's syndrome/scleroderma autoantigen 1 family protein [Halopiger aswanensis]|uniref:Uncharacterized Zn finger protein (UPF0148 family) n=1 Tax=Halopiger aswanensis TaxID=148449 RepID=A0A419WE51_9EURY|nr:Sjogren's syndrome/scleroderma autoantigen 1 family protein [Halopiger aswanensis]RKD93672.1 uncharacterized Zn finger protein (UPF0148 family) [Halopiger aswanensis]